MKRKTLLINECFEAYKSLCEHRGVPFHATDIYINSKKTMQEIENIRLSILNKCDEKLDPATQKQMNFIYSLANNFDEANKFNNIKLNKYQASYLIKLYKDAKDLLYSNCTFSMSLETWEEIDSEINYIIKRA